MSMKTWKTILIDDEVLARERLKRLLKPFSDTIRIIGEAGNGAEGLQLVSDLRPDLIFLDIEMPVYNGFEMLSRLPVQPAVIFATAYDQYAVKAFEENSVDYLLKPVEQDRLEKSIARLQKLTGQPPQIPVDALVKQVFVQKEVKTLTVKTGDRILLVKVGDIAYAEAEDKYVFLHCTDGRKHLTDYTITSLAERLPDNFVRIHRGTILNTDCIREIRKGFNGALVFVLSNPEASRLSSGRSYGEDLRRRFDI
jgi:two-component system, LytTR family, response regulator